MTGLYIHIPFCAKKCYYCDFCSFPLRWEAMEQYSAALVKDIETYCGESIDTIYFGGGTPSLLNETCLTKIVEAINRNFKIEKQSEITFEANPCTITKTKAKLFADLGFNRVSLGAQSFEDRELQLLGRAHKVADIERSYAILRECGFHNISLDLMYAIPEQTMDTLSTSIHQVLKLSPEHISCYGLKVEEGTHFFELLQQNLLTEKTDDEYADMYAKIVEMLTESGYNQYELSNFCKTGYLSKHNTKYWMLCDTIGVGASAASLYHNERYTKTDDFKTYVKTLANREMCTLSEQDRMSEFMFLSLRLTEVGAEKKRFKKTFGKEITDVFGNALSKHIKNGFITDRGDRYVLSKKAYYVSNAVLCDFV